ncbi:MAG: HAD hydrolase-like protein [Candidatus Coproplasma sp.]
MYDYILFDLDGTLTNPATGITNSIIYALDKFGISVEDRASLYKFIGPPLVDSFQLFYGFTKEQSLKAVEYYREYFKVKGIFENQVFGDCERMLSSLKSAGKHIILATSKPEEFAIRILEHFNLIGYFDFTACATMDGTRNNKADVIKYAIEGYPVKDLSKAIMVGDREYDVSGADRAGIASIGVLYGFGDYDELKKANATYIVKDMQEILNIVL